MYDDGNESQNQPKNTSVISSSTNSISLNWRRRGFMSPRKPNSKPPAVLEINAAKPSQPISVCEYAGSRIMSNLPTDRSHVSQCDCARAHMRACVRACYTYEPAQPL